MEYNLCFSDEKTNEVILTTLKDLENIFFIEHSDFEENSESDNDNNEEIFNIDDDINFDRLNKFEFVEIPENYIEDKSLVKHLREHGLKERIHGNTGRAPKNMKCVEVNYSVACDVFMFLKNYSNIHGMPSPGRHFKELSMPIVFLPTSYNYASVYRDYVQASKDEYGNDVLEDDSLEDNYKTFTMRSFSFDTNVLPPTINTKPLSFKRQEELYKEIAPHIDLPFRDITCPRPEELKTS
ncbi:12397_t:CDS:2 [Gigaspora rosea]|nr:12397_t:CDS:2 [Gigaspora rosea]